MTREEFLATQFPGLAAWIREAAATGVGSYVYERDGVAAQVSPEVPDASLVNSVTYRDAGALREALPGLEATYNEAGIRAWTVWVHESDAEATALVRDAGHVLDATPEGMGCALDELVAPEGLDELDYTDSPAIPEARGRGLARRLQYLLLQRARELGARTTTLQASKLGVPVYVALGYRRFGPMSMWERRRPSTR